MLQPLSSMKFSKIEMNLFKNIINRAFITGREAHTLKGILRRLKNNLD